MSSNYDFKDTIYDVRAIFNEADLAIVSGGYTKPEAIMKTMHYNSNSMASKNISSSFAKKNRVSRLHICLLKIEKIIFEIKNSKP